MKEKMKRVIIILMVMFVGWGCSDPDGPVNQTDTKDSTKKYYYPVDSLWPMKIGNYWIYKYEFRDHIDWHNSYYDTLKIIVELIEYGVWSKIVHVKYEYQTFRNSLCWRNNRIIQSDSGIHKFVSDKDLILEYSYPFIEGYKYKYEYYLGFRQYTASIDEHPAKLEGLPRTSIKYVGGYWQGQGIGFVTFFCPNIGLVYHREETSMDDWQHISRTWELIEYHLE